MARRKAKQAVPGVDTEKKRPNKPAIAAALLGVGAALMFWRKRASSDDATEPPV
jgi:hypothetical protein